MKIDHPKTREILKWFEKIAAIPRCSRHEEKISEFMLTWADEHGFSTRMDRVGNIVIEVPASVGYEKAPTVVIQGHLDMVCEKTPDSKHDFTKDPIRLIYKDGWLTADRTTLGADNGIAMAMAMTLALDNDAKHPPLELLFTVDEETGLTGASSLKPGFIRGRKLINLDSEDEGYLTIGCAGGINTEIFLLVNRATAPRTYERVRVTIGGMRGGHSGVDIHLQRANAIKAMARVLSAGMDAGDVRIMTLSGGTAHNAIPRDCNAEILIPAGEAARIRRAMKSEADDLLCECHATDPDAFVKTRVVNGRGRVALTAESGRRVADLLMAHPHGVAAMSRDIEGLVETSNNLANVRLTDDQLSILSSQRSAKVSALMELTHAIEAVGRLAGGRAYSSDGYPPWPPNMDSELLEICTDLYRKKFKKEPVIDVIHAGLECGIIGDRNPGMDMISIGPTLKNPHSPEEMLEIATVGMVWDYLVDLLRGFK